MMMPITREHIISAPLHQEVESSYLDKLPCEVLLHIFAHLNNRDLLEVRRVCRLFYKVATQDCLWKDILYRSGILIQTPPQKPYYAFYCALEESRIQHILPLKQVEKNRSPTCECNPSYMLEYTPKHCSCHRYSIYTPQKKIFFKSRGGQSQIDCVSIYHENNTALNTTYIERITLEEQTIQIHEAERCCTFSGRGWIACSTTKSTGLYTIRMSLDREEKPLEFYFPDTTDYQIQTAIWGTDAIYAIDTRSIITAYRIQIKDIPPHRSNFICVSPLQDYKPQWNYEPLSLPVIWKREGIKKPDYIKYMDKYLLIGHIKRGCVDIWNIDGTHLSQIQIGQKDPYRTCYWWKGELYVSTLTHRGENPETENDVVEFYSYTIEGKKERRLTIAHPNIRLHVFCIRGPLLFFYHSLVIDDTCVTGKDLFIYDMRTQQQIADLSIPLQHHRYGWAIMHEASMRPL